MNTDPRSEISGVEFVDPRPLLEVVPEAAAVLDARGSVRLENRRFRGLLTSASPLPLPLSEGEGSLALATDAHALSGPARQCLEGVNAVLRGERDRFELVIEGEGPAASWQVLADPCAAFGGLGALVRVRSLSPSFFLDRVIDDIPVMLYIKRASDLSYVRITKLAEQYLGRTTQEMAGKTDYDIFPRAAAEQFNAQDRQVIERGEILDLAEEAATLEGKGRRYFRVWKVPIFDDQGRVAYLLGMREDITDRLAAEQSKRAELVLLETQKRLLELIRALSTPLLPVYEGILVAPLVGQMDASRSAEFLQTLLDGVERYRAETVLIDVTGVPTVDAEVAGALVQATRAAGLLGAACALVGVTPQVARTLAQVGIDLGNLTTHRDLQAGIQHALRSRRRASP